MVAASVAQYKLVFFSLFHRLLKRDVSFLVTRRLSPQRNPAVRSLSTHSHVRHTTHIHAHTHIHAQSQTIGPPLLPSYANTDCPNGCAYCQNALSCDVCTAPNVRTLSGLCAPSCDATPPQFNYNGQCAGMVEAPWNPLDTFVCLLRGWSCSPLDSLNETLFISSYACGEIG